MALPASDAFTGSDGTALATHNAGWTASVGAWVLSSNQARGNSGGTDHYATWTGDAFGDAQYSKCAISGMANGSQYRGVFARGAGSGGTFRCYLIFSDGVTGADHTEIGIVTAGSYTRLKAVATTTVDGDVLEIRCNGTTIQFYKNSVLIDSHTDATYSSGSAGIYSFGSNAGIDDWSANNLGGGGTSILRQMMAHHGG